MSPERGRRGCPQALPSTPCLPSGGTTPASVPPRNEPSTSYEHFLSYETLDPCKPRECRLPSPPVHSPLQLHKPTGQGTSGVAFILVVFTLCKSDPRFKPKCQCSLLPGTRQPGRLQVRGRGVWREGAYRVYSDPTTRAYSAPTPRRSQADTRSFSSVCSC